jgi:phosphatidylglycerophosphate synthase
MGVINLHRAEIADWSKQSPNYHNMWQRMAAKTHGIVAPGNLVSLVGALAVSCGLYLVAQHSLTSGIIAIFAGRCADILDGIVADYTKTKSPLGEAIDAAADKIVVGLALLVLAVDNLLPLAIIVLIAVHGIYNSVLAIVSKLLTVDLHPSAIGKMAAVCSWLTILLYLLERLLEQYGDPLASPVLWTARLSFVLFLGLAIVSSSAYTRTILQGGPPGES